MSETYSDHNHKDDSGVHRHTASFWSSVLLTAGVGILLVLYGFGKFTTLFGFNTALILVFVAGYRILYQAVIDLLNRKLSVDLAIVVAAAAAILAGEYFAAAEVMFIVMVGEGLESYAVGKAKSGIAGFVKMAPVLARVRRGGQEVEVSPAEVRVGEIAVIRAGEKIPIDGTVVVGRSSVDESMITGEPMPADKAPGDAVYSGSINEYGLLEVRADRVGDHTTLAGIARLVEEAQKRRAPIERTADTFAKYFLPAVLLSGGAIYLLTGQPLRAVAALVAACPCALVLATPAAITAGIARLAREGVLVKGGAYIESLARVRTVVFDKTGTLTEGRPRVRELVPAPGIDEDELLAVAASAERSSEHLLGRAIVAAGRRRNLSIPEVSGFAVRPGLGVEACVNGRKIRVGNLPLVREALGSEVSWMETTLANHSLNGQTAVAVTADGKPLGIVSLRDCPRPEAAGTVSSLKAIGIRRICMMTGDEEAAARYVGREAGIDEIYSRLLPEEKAKTVLQLRGAEAPLLMVGDGVNDSPSLASADVGIAMGRRAADISAEAAHVVFLKDRLSQIPDVIVYARRVIRRIRTSIILFAFGVNAAAVLLAAFGYLGPAVAAVVHQSASLFVILNCVRLLVEGKAVEEPPLSRVRVLCQQRLHHLLSLDQFRRLVTLDAGRRRTLRRWLPRIALACWLISGLVLITPEQVGVVQRFGRHIPPDLGPGLHYRWPWPVEAVTRLAVRRLRVVEIGYRTDLSPSAALEPRAYEWNTQHRLGRYRKAAEEGLILTGDENLVEINAVVQYGIGDPALYLFHVKDPETLIRTVAEQSLRLSAARQSLDAILTNGRVDLERDWTADLKSRLAEYQCGLEVLSANLQDVHPPVEVVEAFRDVASAQEERSTLINEAEGYMREQLPRARGQSRARLLSAEGYSAARIDRSRGDSSRFNEQEQAYRTAPDVTARRLYLETVEKVLPNKAKYIVDSKKAGRRRFLFLDSTGLNLLNVIEPQTAKPK